jgi:hypothetical protein
MEISMFGRELSFNETGFIDLIIYYIIFILNKNKENVSMDYDLVISAIQQSVKHSAIYWKDHIHSENEAAEFYCI